MSVSSRKKLLKRLFKWELFLFALAFSNVVFINEWMNFIYPRNKLLVTAPNYAAGLTSLFLFIFLLAGVFHIVLYQANQAKTALKHAMWNLPILAVMIFPLNALRQCNNFPIKYPWLSLAYYVQYLGMTATLLLLAASVGIFLFIVLRFPNPFNFFMKSAAHILTGFLIITFLQGIGEFYRVTFLPIQKVEAVNKGHRGRVVVLLFDEMAEEYTAAESRNKLELPELDRFRRESVYSVNAFAPGHMTRISVPSYISGKLIPFEYDVTAEDYSGAYWSTHPTFAKQMESSLFSAARKEGSRVAVAGWHLPYCRLYGAALDYCFFLGASDYDYRSNPLSNLHSVFNRTFHLRDRNNSELYARLLRRAKELVADPQYQLVFIHFPIPHLPGIADENGKLLPIVPQESREEHYLNNMKLVDKTVRDIRITMDQHGRWDSDNVIITSDHGVHWYRPWVQGVKNRDLRVPFMLKMAGSDKGPHTHRLTERFETININSIILSLLRNDPSNEADRKTLGLVDPHLREAHQAPKRDIATRR